MAKSREYLLVWDSTMANPNGDMLNENRPRQDELTGKLEVSDVRIKRFIRDEWINEGKNVLVKTQLNNKSKVMTCAEIVKQIMKENSFKDSDADKLKEYLVKNYIDVRLFGAVITKPKKDIMGALQVTWSKSVNEAEVKFMQGNAAYAGKEGADQSSIWSKFIAPYGLFKTYAVYNDKVALRQDIEVEEDDLRSFVSALINGMKNYRSTSKNQMPRLLIEVIYKDNHLDGELNYIEFNKKVSDLELRDISQVEVDLKKLVGYYEKNKQNIDKINLYKHPNIIVNNVHEDFNVISM